jgi:hypothetical protein
MPSFWELRGDLRHLLTNLREFPGGAVPLGRGFWRFVREVTAKCVRCAREAYELGAEPPFRDHQR